VKREARCRLLADGRYSARLARRAAGRGGRILGSAEIPRPMRFRAPLWRGLRPIPPFWRGEPRSAPASAASSPFEPKPRRSWLDAASDVAFAATCGRGGKAHRPNLASCLRAARRLRFRGVSHWGEMGRALAGWGALLENVGVAASVPAARQYRRAGFRSIAAVPALRQASVPHVDGQAKRTRAKENELSSLLRQAERDESSRVPYSRLVP